MRREMGRVAREKAERGLKVPVGALGIALALNAELIRKQCGTCPAYLIRLDGMSSQVIAG